MQFSKLFLLLFVFVVIALSLTIICSFMTLNFKCSKTTIRPHIILIVADDLGWNDVGFHGSNQIPTPNIDALAYNGIVLNRFYTLPSCTPSRAALLMGQYPISLGLQGLPIRAGENRHLPFDVPTLPEKLKELGYKTHLIGKWHLGAAYKNVTPTYKGFDSYFGYWNGFNMYGFDMHDNLEPSWHTQTQYATHLFTKKAEDVIWTHNQNEPLFLTLSHLASHAGKNSTNLEVPDIRENKERFGYIKDEDRRLYAGIVDELDKSVGQIMEALLRKEILDNSIIMFVSDNGGATKGDYCNSGSNWPLRGIKLSVLEGAIRCIAIVYSSLFTNTSLINNQLMHITDLMPTIYAAAGGNTNNLNKMDGINQWPVLALNQNTKCSEFLTNIDEIQNSAGFLGESGHFKLVNGSTIIGGLDLYYGDDGRDLSNPPYNTSTVIYSPTNRIIGRHLRHEQVLQLRNELNLGNCRKHNLKYDNCSYNNFCLFDLLKDPCETTNVAEKFPDIADKLKRKLAQFWKQLKPQKVFHINPKANPIYYNNSWYTWLDKSLSHIIKLFYRNIILLNFNFMYV